jgi:hypothetical protein
VDQITEGLLEETKPWDFISKYERRCKMKVKKMGDLAASTERR